MDRSPTNKSDVTAYTVDSMAASGYPRYTSSGDGNNNNNNNNIADISTNDNGGRRDVSQFVKYLLEGAGMEEGSVDYAALRQELESITPASAGAGPPPPAPTREQDFHTEDSGFIRIASDVNESPLAPGTSIADCAEDKLQTEGVPVYKAGSLYQTELETLSNKLASVGLPELPFETRSMDIQGSNSVSQLQLLARSLAECLVASVERIRKNAVLINELTTAATTTRSASRPAESSTPFSRDTRDMAQSEDQVDRLRSTARTLTDALRESTIERDRMRTALNNQTALVDSYQQDMDQMRRALIAARQEENARRERAGQMVGAIRAIRGEKPTHWNSKRSATREQGKVVEAATLEIAEVYEEKVQALEKEIQELKQQWDGRTTSYRATAISEDDVLVLNPGTKTSKVQADLDRPPVMEPYSETSKMAMVDEIQELQTQLDTLTTAYEDLLQEKEVLELKLLSAQPGSNVLKEKDKNRKKYSTSELIRLDKAQHRQQIKRIEQMSNEDCQTILKNICVKLDVGEIDNLVSYLADIAKAVRLIPQMQIFIKTVDTIIWSPPRVLNQLLTQSKQQKAAPHKLADTLTTLESWRRVVEKYQRPSSRANESEPEQVMEVEPRSLQRDPPAPTMRSLDAILGRVEEEERRWEETKRLPTMEE